MAKFDWGFNILNKNTAYDDKFVDIRCTRSPVDEADARFALDGHPTHQWGDVIESTMSPTREIDAENALVTWGWL